MRVTKASYFRLASYSYKTSADGMSEYQSVISHTYHDLRSFHNTSESVSAQRIRNSATEPLAHGFADFHILFCKHYGKYGDYSVV